MCATACARSAGQACREIVENAGASPSARPTRIGGDSCPLRMTHGPVAARARDGVGADISTQSVALVGGRCDAASALRWRRARRTHAATRGVARRGAPARNEHRGRVCASGTRHEVSPPPHKRQSCAATFCIQPMPWRPVPPRPVPPRLAVDPAKTHRRRQVPERSPIAGTRAGSSHQDVVIHVETCVAVSPRADRAASTTKCKPSSVDSGTQTRCAHCDPSSCPQASRW